MTASSHSRPAPSDSAAKRTRGHLDFFLSLLVPQPEFVMASWDIWAATKQYFGPFLAGFPLNFSVSSQVAYLSIFFVAIFRIDFFSRWCILALLTSRRRPTHLAG